MRSSTSSDLPGRCNRCWIREAFCLCADIPSLDTRTHVLIVRHEREAYKSTGTARIAQLALKNSSILASGEEADRTNDVLTKHLTGAWLLFPSDNARPAPGPNEPPIERLIVLDGTWRQTRRMYRRMPALQGLPTLALPNTPAPVLRLRETSFAEGRSTLEAIADALALTEAPGPGPSVSQSLHALHALFVERVFRARGVWDMKRQNHDT